MSSSKEPMNITNLQEFKLNKDVERMGVMRPPVMADKVLGANGDRILKDVMKGLKLDWHDKAVFDRFPGLRTNCVKLCSMISAEYPHVVDGSFSDEPAISVILKKAFEAYKQEPESSKWVAVQRQAAFQNALRNSADALQSVCVYGVRKRDMQQWNWFSEPLGDWVKRIGARSILFTLNYPLPISDAMKIGGRQKLAGEILSIHNMGRLSILYGEVAEQFGQGRET